MKIVAGNIYRHREQLESLDSGILTPIKEALRLTSIQNWTDFDLIRHDESLDDFSFLRYTDFVEDAFPKLLSSHKVNLSLRKVTYRDYAKSLNPPILHRKELFNVFDEALLLEWGQLTKALEEIGAFDEPLKIGYLLQWEDILYSKGFYVDGHQLLPLANQEGGEQVSGISEFSGVQRHLTALTRYSLSGPVQQLIRCGLLTKEQTFFDYGCGRGDDLTALTEQGYQGTGWDPYFASDRPQHEADVVNLGFVLNVIEDPLERVMALKRALKLSKKVLSVGVMIANENNVSGVPYADGVLTSRQTFQKYFSQQELIEYLHRESGLTPFPVAPGICFIFKDETMEQQFLLSRQTSRSIVAEGFHFRRERRIREKVARIKLIKPSLFEVNREMLDDLWELTLNLGREPQPEEISNVSELIEVFGSVKKALKLNWNHQNLDELELAAKQRRADISVYFALEKFRQQRSYSDQPTQLKTDVRYFFGSLKAAQDTGLSLLREVPDVKSLWESAKRGGECGIGFFDEAQDHYYVAADKIGLQDPIVRVFIGCAAALYGDASASSLIKIHIRSSKVTFLSYDDFYGSPLPLLVLRVKINLKTLRMDLFSYEGQYTPPPLFNKSRFLNEADPNYLAQIAFEEQLIGEGFEAIEERVESLQDINKILESACLKIQGFELVTTDLPPDLDSPCGRYFRYRDFFHCGETQLKTQVANLPKEMASYRAYYLLATHVLDPLIDYYGPIKLTYGFCGDKLRSLIKKRVSHDRDQHASFEKKRSGELVCSRGGAACDFIVEDEDMLEVAQWLVENTPIDRMYFYGPDRPLHVSYKTTPDREFYEMLTSDSGKLSPRKLSF